MLTSAAWINDYLDPPASAEEQADWLTRAGFPLESSEPVENGADTRQDFEMTSNRGDCVCHLGLAREIAAIARRTLMVPAAKLKPTGPTASSVAKVINKEHDLCPLYTARVIQGITVGPSPDWLAKRLRARGDIPRNNVVDATNFVNFERGQPTHVFDLDLLAEKTIIIRLAQAGERFLPLGEGEKEITLDGEDLVIADAKRAVALAGVKGGAATAVTNKTADILIEAATFHPVSVRNTSRRHQILTDSSYRFERGVHPAQVNPAADRLASLIMELAGGTLCEGVVSDGKPIPEPRHVSMRPERCRRLLGIPVSDEDMLDALTRLGFQPKRKGGRIDCTVPIHRLDVEREIDLIEEVGRMAGHDTIPVREQIEIRAAPVQPELEARRAVFGTLVGNGFVETVTHSLVPEKHAGHFFTDGMSELRVDDERAKAWPVLQPSVLPGLLRVRAVNDAGGVEHLKLFESASTFWRTGKGHREIVKLGLLADVEDAGDGLRPLRGVIDRIVRQLAGRNATTDVAPDDAAPWFAPGAVIRTGDQVIGRMGIVSGPVLKAFALDRRLLAAELELTDLYADYPPDTEAEALPAYPAIERDVSAILEETVIWADLHRALASLDLEHLEAIEFVVAFRGKPIERGRKSLTFRLRFRAADRTLVHDDVDAQMQGVLTMLPKKFNAEIRTS